MRLIIASCSGKRNKRGLGLPGCARGVTVPTSIKPKPSLSRPTKCSAFLSKPAAKPTGLGNFKPITSTGASKRGLAIKRLKPKRAVASRLSKAN